MRKYSWIIAILTMIFFGSCHTYVWQSVKKQIVGKWQRSGPDTSKAEIWEFGSDGHLVISYKYKIGTQDTTVILNFINPSTNDTLPYVSYSVANKVSKNYVYTDAWFGNSEYRWLVIKLNKKFMYLESEYKKKTKGTFQIGFKKI